MIDLLHTVSNVLIGLAVALIRSNDTTNLHTKRKECNKYLLARLQFLRSTIYIRAIRSSKKKKGHLSTRVKSPTRRQQLDIVLTVRNVARYFNIMQVSIFVLIIIIFPD